MDIRTAVPADLDPPDQDVEEWMYRKELNKI